MRYRIEKFTAIFFFTCLNHFSLFVGFIMRNDHVEPREPARLGTSQKEWTKPILNQCMS